MYWGSNSRYADRDCGITCERLSGAITINGNWRNNLEHRILAGSATSCEFVSQYNSCGDGISCHTNVVMHANFSMLTVPSRVVAIGALAAAVLFLGGCRLAATRSTQLPAEVRFAREFVRVLQDSGSSAVLPLTTPKTRALRGFAPNMDILRGVLASSKATLTLAAWNTVPAKEGVPSSVHVVFKASEAGAPSELELWIEGDPGHFLLNTIKIGRPNPPGS